MAADERGSQLLGLEIAGTGRRHQPAARDILRRPELRDIRRGVRELLWQSADLYPAEISTARCVGSWSPAYEAIGCRELGKNETFRRWRRKSRFRFGSASPITSRSGKRAGAGLGGRR